MKIGLRGGHSENHKGASSDITGYDEWSQMQELYRNVKTVLEAYGHTVIDCNAYNSSSINDELTQGTSKATNNGVDIFISLHMNAFNGSAQGHECWIFDENRNTIAKDVAKRIAKNFGNHGFKLRPENNGVKGMKQYNKNYHDLKAPIAPAIIVETIFCDSLEDKKIWAPTSWDELARLVVNGIDPNIPLMLNDSKKSKEPSEGYVVTGYLDKQLKNYDGAEVAGAIRYYFKDIDRVYIRSNSIGMWLETQLLPMDKCKEIKELLGSWGKIRC
ncbi:N-acetylmuramoyl-L-alanine amidase [Clostridium hydrogeniformans]|uniref:N-acetylmuramoyl-L-alanine amidase n=1 Tax=Clostridium hydrogeniformans TaxID=349933 RepID=UPI00048181F9|nr:N-acetylmuramoyl-L-alanine amidase [Clostridium hydrogeniformans]